MGENDFICKSINGLNIIKIILPSFNKDELGNKLIFVGYRPENIKQILTKIEKKEKLTDKEKKELELSIPYYNTKFGDIETYNIIFIYKYLEENLPIKHFKIILYETIKKYLAKQLHHDINEYQPHRLLIYKFQRNIV